MAEKISKEEFRSAMMQAFEGPPARLDVVLRRLRVLHPWFRDNQVYLRSMLVEYYGPQLLPPDGTATAAPMVSPPAAIAAPRRRFALEEEPDEPELPAVAEPFTVHMCIICGTFWKLWENGGGWSLYHPVPVAGKCCDNVRMGEQIVRVYFTPAAIPAPPIPDLSREVFVQITREQIEAMGEPVAGTFDLQGVSAILKDAYEDFIVEKVNAAPTPNSEPDASIGTWLGVNRSLSVSSEDIEKAKASPGAFVRAMQQERAAMLKDLERKEQLLGTPADGAELEDDIRRLRNGPFGAPWPRGLDGMPLSAEQAAEEYKKLTGQGIDPEQVRRLLTSKRKASGFFARALDRFGDWRPD